MCASVVGCFILDEFEDMNISLHEKKSDYTNTLPDKPSLEYVIRLEACVGEKFSIAFDFF